MRLLPFALILLVAARLAPDRQEASSPLVVDLWPGKPPGDPDGIEEKSTPGEKGPKRVDGVAKPTIAVYKPAKDKDTGAAIVVAPGGGYRMLAFEHEGTMVAEWLTSIGVTCVLLKYRVPQRPGDGENKLPLQDAQRALSLTRARSAQWGIDPARIGILGFSAGGHLAANASTNYDRRAYEPQDEADKAGCRPDFAVLVYPGGVLDRQDKEKLSPQIRITKETPPSLLVVANDDKGSAPGTIRLFMALREAGVSSELHVYATGGHGFGMRKSDQPWGTWPQRCEEWMRARGLFKASPPGASDGK
jgi:acetyl esterase/lipase